MDSGRLQRHIQATYVTLRLGIAILAASLPLILWIGDLFLEHAELRGSMSAYYRSCMRDFFVGFLFAIGAFLYLYKGYSTRENILLNIAGCLAVGVAVFPLDGLEIAGVTIHAACAVLFFCCIAAVCLFCSGDTLGLLPTREQQRFRRLYSACAATMIASPIAAAILIKGFGFRSSSIFFIEAAGIFAFALYWIFKSLEIKNTDSELLAIHGRMR